MSKLTTVPTFMFNDDYELTGECPTQVLYWNEGAMVELRQGDNEVYISIELLNKLVKQIKKNLPEATKFLKNR